MKNGILTMLALQAEARSVEMLIAIRENDVGIFDYLNDFAVKLGTFILYGQTSE